MNATIKRIFNFSAGPATLPLSVLEEASKGVLEFAGSGMSRGGTSSWSGTQARDEPSTMPS